MGMTEALHDEDAEFPEVPLGDDPLVEVGGVTYRFHKGPHPDVDELRPADNFRTEEDRSPVDHPVHGEADVNRRRLAKLVDSVAGLAVPAPAFGSGWLDKIGGVGARAIPLDIALPIKGAIARGEIRPCWITGQPIQLEQLSFDHIIPFSYGGATNSANLLPAGKVANCGRGNSLKVLWERKIGWKWDLDGKGLRVRVPDQSQRLVRVFTSEGEAVYCSVPVFDLGQFAVGAAGSAGLAVGIQGAMQWHTGEFQPDRLGEEAAKAAAGYAARYSAKIAVKALAPRAIALGASPAGVELLGSLAGPIGLVAAIYAAEAIGQGVALARGKVTAAKAAKAFALAPISAVKDAAGLAEYGYKLVSPRHRAIRKSQRKWRSINFVPDLKRPDPAEVLASTPSVSQSRMGAWRGVRRAPPCSRRPPV
jgi:hypothetical protein